MHSFFFRSLTGIATFAVFTLVAMTGTAPTANAQAAPAAQKKVKDQGEFDLYNGVLTEKDPAKKLQNLEQWTQKYPDTDFKEERLQLYNSLKQPAKVVDLGSAMLSKDPKNLTALVLVAANIPLLPNPTPEQMSNGEKAAQTLKDNLDSLKPPAVSDADWKSASTNILHNANAAMLYVAMLPGQQALAKKDFPTAEEAFKKALQTNPGNGQVAYSLGSAILSQKKVDRYPEAMYYIARGASIEPDKGGLPEATRKQVEAYITKIFTQYHGDDPAELAKLKELVKTSPTPPAGFTIETQSDILARKEKEFREKNPQLALWLVIKKELTGPTGEQYFEDKVKGSAVPKLKGTVISAKPAVRSKELVLGLENATTPEVTLKLETPLTGKPKLGGEVEFEGVPTAFSKDPFMLTFETEKAKISGLEVEAPPRVAPKKSAKKK